MTRRTSQRVPDIWQGVRWAMQPGLQGGGTSRARLVWRAIQANLRHGKAMRRWMAVAFELHSREVIRDLEGEFLRAVRPSVHRGVGYAERVVQLVDHMDWLETAFLPPAFAQIAAGEPLVLMELAAPPGYDFMRLQLQQAPVQSPEGELLLTLTLQRSAELQHKPQPLDAGVLAFSRFRIEGTPCLAIGGVRGQRHPVQRVSSAEIAQVLQGWKPAVLLVRVAQELARHWSLKLVGLDPAAHRLQGWSYRWNRRNRQAGERIFDSYRALWDHFNADNGPPGWVIVPLEADDKLAATALSPEKRARQTRRADFWIRTRNQLRAELRKLLQRPGREARLSRVTQALGPATVTPDQDSSFDFEGSSEELLPSRVLETGSARLP
ncbi:hypothetical protein GCM10027034_45210 [Ramlibacter solisilvae]|uniref:DUF535 domain-containing protein n=1 Tax=Ramlibacter tataouinensis TaxID=94132 RepID=A0A127JSS1_9BURK|nr:DUF535 family protein [Ramlibacter tataouinensis]AMO23048.1 hypothetical protein UC35_09285 [Ramlibacter tataouinensis]